MATISASHESPWATPQKLNLRYGLVVLCVLSQLLTVGMSWPLWQVRPLESWIQLSRNSAIGAATSFVNYLPPAPLMPLVDLPQIPFEWLMVGSLLVVLVCPRWGVPIHTAVLLVSFVFDQYRTQPQFMANVALMWGCANLRALGVIRWVLVSLWLWAGLHKLISPDWLGAGSWHSLNEINLYPDDLYFAFAIVVAAGEMLLGVLAIFKPRWAAYYCVALHVGIVIYLSPWVRDYNEHALPWNLCTAVVGYWIMLHSKPGWPENRSLQLAAATLLIYPAGFYTGWVDHGISHVLYSDNHAIAMVTSREIVYKPKNALANEDTDNLPEWVDRGAQISGFGDLCVPFPNERRLHLIYFERVGKPGEKMHIHDPRPWGGDDYFLKQSDGQLQQLDEPEFFAAPTGQVGGIALEPYRVLFALGQADVQMLRRDAGSAIYALKVKPTNFKPALLEIIGKLKNLEQIQLQDCPVTDDDLRRLPTLCKLRGIGLEGTKVTIAGLRHLLKYPNLEVVFYGNGRWTLADLEAMTEATE